MEGLNKPVTLNVIIGRPGLLRAVDAALRRPETVVPTGAGLRTRRMAEELDLPYFVKASKGL